MLTTVSEPLDQKESRLKRLNLLDFKINALKQRLHKLESEVSNIIKEDSDYVSYVKDLNIFNSLHYENYCNSIKSPADLEEEFTEKMWHQTLDILKSSLNEISYNTWITNLKFMGVNDNKIILQTPGYFNLNIVKERYEHLILIAISLITSKTYEINYTVAQG